VNYKKWIIIISYVAFLLLLLHKLVIKTKILYYAALLHDIGKVGVKEDVLQKRTKISEETLELLEFKFLYFKDKIVNKDNKTDNEKLFLDKFDIYLQTELHIISHGNICS
jgi:HD superfamily phosphodiesterase